ncbi:hypothetical protein V6N12_018279 [Hibiscus sabdariffa]|uniref:PMI1/PMIR1-2 C-terminal domain-containing protein n=1 Tax=Hibiscus sabdariffa TaxID=183260 RepID=A0ABR2BPW4_9ROSI
MSLAELESDFHDLLIRESSVSESLSALDEFIDNEKFMEMLEIEHGPFNLNSDDTLDSPRERLLREFEIEALASGRSRGKESLSLANRRPVKMLEYIETEALMREWGLDEKAFQSSPCVRTDGFGSPIELSPERVELPPLGEGFGHFIPTKDEGVLRSMNPSQFINCKNVGHLAMQLDKLMPLEDITGKTLQQVALEAASTAVALERWDELKQELLCEQDSFDQRNEVEGFQFCWTHDNTCSGLIGKDSELSNLLSSEGADGQQSLDSRDDVNRLMGLSITLDEWLRLDGGAIDDGDHISDHTIQILEAYQAKCLDSVGGNLIKHVDLVGTSMLALIQVERAHVALEPERDQEENPESKAAEEKGGTPFFNITEVHLAGLNAEPDKQHLWGSKAQQQSGTRWLLASGAANSKKKTYSKSKAIVRFYPSVMRKMQSGNVLWSLTSIVDETTLEELADSGPHSRNPNVILLN